MRNSIIVLLFYSLLSCQTSNVPLPKPRAYPKISYPERSYIQLNNEACPISFRYPSYLSYIQDASFFETKPPHPCWFTLHNEALGVDLHCNYTQIDEENNREKLVNDVFKIADWHNKKASYIDEQPISSKTYDGVLFNIEGPVASPFQFYVVDKKESSFFRGSLYFQTAYSQDSLRPVYQFIRSDIDTILNSFTWQ